MTGGNKRILVVEDDASVRSFLQVLLEGEGYEVLTAADGLQGLLQLDLQHPDAVILDLMMPNVSGDRVIRQIREDGRMREVPVLVVSGRHDVRESFGPILGEKNVFEKPFEPASLLARLREVLA
ncbi:MAG: response regulator transcription factor [Actinomycetota bacterium]